MRVRRAIPSDLDAIVALKHALRWSDRADGREGFVLGADVGAYAHWLGRERIDVLEDAGRLVGFSVVLDDAEARARGLVERAAQIDGRGQAPTGLLDAKLAYFDQLAVAAERRPRLYAPALALSSLLRAFAQGHEHVFATTVRAPVCNRAAWRLLTAMKAQNVGTLDEVHPAIGPLRSDVHWIAASTAQQALAQLRASGSSAFASLDAIARSAL